MIDWHSFDALPRTEYRVVPAYLIASSTECLLECPDGRVIRFDCEADAEDWAKFEQDYDDEVQADTDPILAVRRRAQEVEWWLAVWQQERQRRIDRWPPF